MISAAFIELKKLNFNEFNDSYCNTTFFGISLRRTVNVIGPLVVSIPRLSINTPNGY